MATPGQPTGWIQCNNCGHVGHGSRDCPRPKQCSLCHARDHRRNECPHTQAAPLCQLCFKEGHKSADCPKREELLKLKGVPVAAPLKKQEAKFELPPSPLVTGPPRRFLVSGDAVGRLKDLFSMVERQSAKVGHFDALLCVGSFSRVAETSSCPYLLGDQIAPAETYFIDSSPLLIQGAPAGCAFGEGLHFLGGYGVREIEGIRVAFLSGLFNEANYNTAEVDFIGQNYTSRAISELQRLCSTDPWSRGIDVLLTCEWPSGIERKIFDGGELPVDPDGSRPSWSASSVEPIADLVMAIEPRYHMFGTADLFYQRVPFITPNGGHVSRCVGLGKVGSKEKHRKWIHAVSLTPMAQMAAEEISQLPSNATPCPFQAKAKRGTRRPLVNDVEAEKRSVRAKVAACLAKPASQVMNALQELDSDKRANLAAEWQQRTVADGGAAPPASSREVALAALAVDVATKARAEALARERLERTEKDKAAQKAAVDAKALADESSFKAKIEARERKLQEIQSQEEARAEAEARDRDEAIALQKESRKNKTQPKPVPEQALRLEDDAG